MTVSRGFVKLFPVQRTANKSIFEDVRKALVELVCTEELKEENQRELKSKQKDLTTLDICSEKLSMKFKWMKYSDRGKEGSRKSPVIEPAWYKNINPLSQTLMEILKVHKEQATFSQIIQMIHKYPTARIEKGQRY